MLPIGVSSLFMETSEKLCWRLEFNCDLWYDCSAQPKEEGDFCSGG
jgi:hypothetical protein